MTETPTQTLAEAIGAAFGENSWAAGDLLRKAVTRRAFADALGRPPHQVKATDLKNLVNQLWETECIEVIPPRDRERSFKFRLRPKPPAADSALAAAPPDRETASPENGGGDLVLDAYNRTREETKLRHVYLSDLCEATGLPAEDIRLWAKAGARARRFELGQADWSLATASQREASVKINGIHYLTVGLL